MRFTKSMLENPLVFDTFNGRTVYWRHTCLLDDNKRLWATYIRGSKNRTGRINFHVYDKSKLGWINEKMAIFPKEELTAQCYIPQTGKPEDTKAYFHNESQKDSTLEDWRPYAKKIHDVIIERMERIQ